jgi:hypothetical protein
LQSKHGSIDDRQYGPCKQADAPGSAIPTRAGAGVIGRVLNHRRRGVAVQDAFKEHILKPGNHLIGSMVETKAAFRLWVNWIQRGQPHRGEHHRERGPQHRGVDGERARDVERHINTLHLKSIR